MKKIHTFIGMALLALPTMAQEIEMNDPDTTRMKIGKTTIIIIDEDDDPDTEDLDSLDTDNDSSRKKTNAHWAGVDFGINTLMDANFGNGFNDYPYWRNDPAKSYVWNLNVLEYKFNFGTPHVGLTTGLGFHFTSVAFKDNYLLRATADSVYAIIDTATVYSKNKLKASYLMIPLLLEFNTSADASKNFYFSAGVVGGVRLTSKLKRKGEIDGKEFKQKEKGVYGLNPFKVDAAVRLGYGDWGVFANYSLLPLFEQDKTVEIYPLTFGLSFNF